MGTESPNPFLAGKTIAVSGHLLNNRRHDDVYSLTNRYGGKFEDIDVSSCTHLLATPKTVERDLKKVRDASEVEGLQIVSPDWFFESVEKEMLLDTKKFLLKTPLKKIVRAKKPSRDEKSHQNIKEKKDELHAIIDEDCPSRNDKDLVVWLDDQNTVWDAVLIKDKTIINKGVVQDYLFAVDRLQLLYNLKTKELRFWHKESTSASSKGTASANSKGKASASSKGEASASSKGEASASSKGEASSNSKGDKNSLSKEQFRNYFFEQTGLSWEDRWDVPLKGKYVFVPRIFEDVEIEDTISLNEKGIDDSTKLPPEVYTVLGLIFDQHQKASMEHTMNSVSGGRLSNQTLKVRATLRVAQSLLERISEIILDRFKRTGESRAKTLSSLGNCYLSLMWKTTLGAPPVFTLPARQEDKEWVKREQAALGLLKNLCFALDLLQNAPKVPKNQILNRAYRGLGLANMTPVMAGTAEHKALTEHIIKTAVEDSDYCMCGPITPINIFRIEREGESKRFDQYQKSHKDLVGDRRLLFHGSWTANMVGILSQGLRSDAQTRITPTTPLRGVYFADVSSNSADYSLAGGPGDSYCMLLCEVEVGNKTEVLRAPSVGVIQTMHQAGHIAKLAAGTYDYSQWRDAKVIHPDLAGIKMPDTSVGLSESKRISSSLASLAYNEWIVFNPAQIRQRYLYQFKVSNTYY